MEASVQVRTSDPTEPEIEQLTPVTSPVGVPADQSTPDGSGSLTETPRAVPSPLLVTVMSKPIASPALTGPAGLAVLVISMTAGATVKHSVPAFVWDAPS
jgi:hypothetical protein